MWRDTDSLVEYILSEIALCGVQGAGSADFRRFIQRFYEEHQSPTPDSQPAPDSGSQRFTRKYYEKVWEWVVGNNDVRIAYRNEPRNLSLTEFEALELQETGSNGADYSGEQATTTGEVTDTTKLVSRSVARPSLRDSLRKRLHGNGRGLESFTNSPQDQTGQRNSDQPSAQKDVIYKDADSHPQGEVFARTEQYKPMLSKNKGSFLKQTQDTTSKPPVFDNIPASTTAPRIYVSQDRTWIAVAGHPVDLKRLSALQFELLSIIAAHGEDGIGQPDLVKISGQDKRSVPHRTDELAKAGYIEKTPISYTGVRTSLCVHKRFIKAGHFLKDSIQHEDVFRNRTVILSSLVRLLYNVLKDAPKQTVKYISLRERLGVSVQEWNTRGIRSSVRRLEETGFLERRRAFTTGNNTAVVVRLLRPPTDEDLKYINYRRKTGQETGEEVAYADDDVEDEGEDDIMKDLEDALDMDDDEVEDERIPPQWSPDRLFPNIAFQAVEMAGHRGTDASKLRDRTMGRFWKRPTESYISRLTDNWETSQPLHMRHLALVRDTAITKEKKLVHYVYRTYGNFQKAVDAKEASWAAVSREALKSSSSGKKSAPKKTEAAALLNQWGFHDISMNNFHQKRGASTLTECSASVIRGRRNGPRWDIALSEGLGVKKRATPKTPQSSVQETARKSKTSPLQSLQQTASPLESSPVLQSAQSPSQSRAPKGEKKTKQLAVPLLSAEQRKALNLPPRGRLGIHIENQIREHREKTGDPTSLPDVIYTEPEAPKEKKPKKKVVETKLFTKAFRRKYGLPENGKLHQNIIEHYRQLEREGKLDAEDYDPSMPRPDKSGTRGTTGEDAADTGAELEGLDSDDRTGPERASEIRGDQNYNMDLSTVSGLSADVEFDVPTDTGPVPAVDARNSPTPQPVEDSITAGRKRRAEAAQEAGGAPKKLRVETEILPGLSTPVSSAVAPPEDAVMASIETPGLIHLEVKDAVNTTIGSAKPKNKVLNPADQVIVDRFMQREEPGLYYNPFATRPVPRGRPKKAFLAVIKSTRLGQFEWFTPELGADHVPTPIKPAKTNPRSSKKSGNDQPPALPYTPQATPGPASTLASSIAGTPTNVRFGTEFDGSNTHSEIVEALRREKAGRPSESLTPRPEYVKSRLEQATHQDETITHQPQLAAGPGDSTTQPGGVVYRDEEGPVEPSSVGASAPSELTLPQAQHIAPQPVRTHTGWNAVNSASVTQAQLSQLSTKSPGRASVTSGAADDSVSQQSSSRRRTPTSSENDVAIMGLPNMRAAVYKRQPKQGALSKRGVVLGRGYVWAKRTEIIMEIINRCAGIFPFNGEMVEPFFKLWDEQATSTMSRPDRTTISAAMNRLIDGPDHKLWKLAFRIPTLDSKTTVEKFLVARTDIAATDPRIKEMQNNIMKAYPKKFFPEEIRHLAGPEPVQNKHQEPDLDPTISLYGRAPTAMQKLSQRILDSAHTRKRVTPRKKLYADAPVPSIAGRKGGRPRRLETLSANVARPAKGTLARRLLYGDSGHAGVPRSLGHGQSLKRPHHNIFDATSSDVELVSDETDTDTEKYAQPTGTYSDGFVNLSVSDFFQKRSTGNSKSLLNPSVQFYPSNGTFSTDFKPRAIRKAKDKVTYSSKWSSIVDVSTKLDWQFVLEQPRPTKRKRVRFANADEDSPHKKRRLSLASQYRKHGAPTPPTLVERLSGLTGDLNDPVYIIPMKKKRYRPRPNTWRPAKPMAEKKEAAEKPVVEFLDPAEIFQKLIYTLTIASSMSGEDNLVDWNIVSKVYSSDSGVNLEKAKKLWVWMQRNMAEEFRTLTTTFQSDFLEAYEKGMVASIEDPETYDWAALVRWAMRTCEYPEPRLPRRHNTLAEYVVEESKFRDFDRTAWASKPLAHVIRAQRVLKYAYAVPLHGTSKPEEVDSTTRARSWIRSNTATSQRVYNSNTAHDKLATLGGPTLERVVGDMVRTGMIRQRKVKRLLPGRNFQWTARFAQSYRCTFEQTAFMDAVQFKKSLDTAFASNDPEQRYFTLSKTARDGAIMALLSLVSEGQVKLVPILPAVNNKLRAPTPRLSVWGFMEGDYVHRKIDRKQLFWDIQAVPTSTYQFGNPLKPSHKELDSEGRIEWRQLIEPPLPGKDDGTAPLPIWSSIDGQHVTWPWWYRILNLVLQALMFQPGSSTPEIHNLCPLGTVELFEIELVLKWLVANKAARETDHHTFMVKGGFWAAFGAEFRDMEDDDFGDHVKRNRMSELRQPWKMQYSLLSPRVEAILRGRGHATVMPDGEDQDEQEVRGEDRALEGIMDADNEVPGGTEQARQTSSAEANQGMEVETDAQQKDVDGTMDEDGDAHMDAEGEPDEDIY